MAGILKVDQVQSDSNLSFQVAGANVAYMNSTGLQMTGGQITAGGNTLLTASGLIYANAGIAFPATQNASAGPNTLDDYEEGTWTPVVYTDGDNSTVSFSNTGSRYLKVGKLVTFYSIITRTAASATSGNIYIRGLPYTPETTNPTIVLGGVSWFDNGGVTTDYTAITYVEGGSASIYFTQMTNPSQQAASRYVRIQDLSNNRPIYIAGSYQAVA